MDGKGGHPPALTMPFSLQLYLDQFDAVCERKFARSYDLAKPEKLLAVLRDGKHLLTVKDVTRVLIRS